MVFLLSLVYDDKWYRRKLIDIEIDYCSRNNIRIFLEFS